MEIVEADIQLIKDAIKSIDWEITHLSPSELESLKVKYSYVDSNYSRETLADLTREKIRDLLCADNGSYARPYFSKIHRHFLFRIFLDGTNDELFCNVTGQLFHAFKNENCIAKLSRESLVEALLCLKDYQRLYNSKLYLDKIEHADSRLKTISNSILTLKRKVAVVYNVKNGNVWVDSTEFERIGLQLHDKMKSLGGVSFLKSMFHFLHQNKRFDEKAKRYHFPISTSQVNDKLNPTTPWGYLFNLAIQFPDDGDSDKSTKPFLWKDIIEISTALVSALDVEPYSTWDTEFKVGTDAVKMMSDISLLESNFKIPQMRYSDLLTIIKGCFSWTEEYEDAKFQLTYSDLNYFINRFLKHLSSPAPAIVDIDELRSDMKRLTDEKFDLALEVFTHQEPPNQKFSSPADYVGADGFFKPFIKCGHNSILIPCPPYSCYAALEAICSYYRAKIKSFDDKVGAPLEKFVNDQISKFKVRAKSGEYENSDGEVGEIDAAVEFDDLIVLIEVKKKSFTRKARSGHWDSVLIDAHKSLLDSQHQALGHEYTLTKDKVIKFKGGDTLELNDRSIEKITLVLFDYGAIQDKSIIRQLLPMYMQCRFSSDDEKLSKSFKVLNERCIEFSDRYAKHVALFDEPPNIPFFSSWFFSLPQFLVLLDDVKNISDLKVALWNTKFVTLKALDWYYEHSYMRSLKSNNS